MIRDAERWGAFEAEWAHSHRPDYAENLRVVEGMYQLARSLGHFTPGDALDGIDKTIRLARLLHRVRGTP